MMKECDWYFDKNNDPFPLKYFGIGKVLSISEKEALPEKNNFASKATLQRIWGSFWIQWLFL